MALAPHPAGHVRNSPGLIASILIGAGVAVSYVVAARLGFRLAFVAEQVTTVWPPTGIAIATLLLGGVRFWPAIWVGAFIANASATAPIWTAPVIASGNTLEAVVAAWALRRAATPQFDISLRRVDDVLSFLLIAVVLCTALSATIGVSALCLAGVQPWARVGELWWDWWFGDALGAVVVAPAILTTARHAWSRSTLTRMGIFVAATIVLTHLVFGVFNVSPHPLEFIIFPLVIAAAVSGGPPVTSLVVLSALATATFDTAQGAGPFANRQLHESLVLLQVFMSLLAASGLLLAAAVDERRTSADLLRLAQRAGGVATFHWDIDRQVAYCSAEFFRIFGKKAPRDGLIRSSEWGAFVHPDDRERMTGHLARALSGSEPACADYRIVRPDGSMRWLSYAGDIDFARDGVRMVGTVVDITDRKLLETELRRHASEVEAIAHDNARLYQEAEAANRLKDEFLATLSHELRTPLNAVLGWAHMLRQGVVQPSMQERALASLERNARVQAQLVDDLLDMSRITAGKLHISSEPVDIGVIVANAVDTVGAGVSAKGLNLHVELPFNGPLVVMGDADRLQQVVWNLVSNAVKFTPDGGRIDVVVQQQESKAEIVVRDTGQGIDPSFRPFLFQRFRQVDGSKASPHNGLGLGLSIVRHLVEAHGGTVAADSEGLGHGATFRVLLPLPRPAIETTVAGLSQLTAGPTT